MSASCSFDAFGVADCKSEESLLLSLTIAEVVEIAWPEHRWLLCTLSILTQHLPLDSLLYLLRIVSQGSGLAVLERRLVGHSTRALRWPFADVVVAATHGTALSSTASIARV